jgi:hypothetical protein
MMFLVLLASAALVTSWSLYSWYCLFLNYFIARKVGIPLRVIPISHENPLWMVVGKSVFIPLFEKLPFGTGSFTRFNWRGWEFGDKYHAHQEIGDIFMVVTPGRNWVHLCDPEALSEVLKKEHQYPRPMEIFEMTKVFGDNLSTVCYPCTIRTRFTLLIFAGGRQNVAEAPKDYCDGIQRTKQRTGLDRKYTPRSRYGAVLGVQSFRHYRRR